MTGKRITGESATMEGTSSGQKYTTVSFNNMTESGAYYSHSNGWLYRVPPDILALGHTPLINIVSYDDNFVTKISDDPWIPVNKARQICSNMDFAVKF